MCLLAASAAHQGLSHPKLLQPQACLKLIVNHVPALNMEMPCMSISPGIGICFKAES